MKSSDATLRATLYNANVMALADLLDVDLAIEHQYWCTTPQSWSIGGHTYAPGPVMERGPVRGSYGTEVATCDILLKGMHEVAGRTLSSRALTGEFDNRDVSYKRIAIPAWGDTPSMAFDVFTGRVAEVILTSTTVELRLKSILYKTEEQRPLRVMQPMCPWVLYSPECGAVQSSHEQAHTTASGSTTSSVVLQASAAGYAGPGSSVRFTSGPLNGVVAAVRSYDDPSRTLSLVSQLPTAPGPSVSCYATRGCDRRRATCGTTFNRLVAMGGFPDAPPRAA